MAGVCRSFTLDDVLAGKAGNDAEAMRRNTVVGHSGDVFITITPGWEIEAADVNAGQNSRPMVSRARRCSPVLFLLPESPTVS